MEIFREIEGHFASLEEGQREMTARMDAIESAMLTIHAGMKSMADGSRALERELSAVRGCFASVEAMLITNAAQMTDVLRRLDALEKRAS